MTAPDHPADAGGTLAAVADRGRLAAAWADVLASDLDDGALSTGVAHFAQEAEGNLAEIAAQLQCGTYKHAPTSTRSATSFRSR
jgi:hypothetical protein